MYRRTVLVLSVLVVGLLAIAVFLPFSQLPQAKSINLAAYEDFSVRSDEEKVQTFLHESAKRKSEIYKGLLESEANQMTLNPSQKQWVQDAVNFYDEGFFTYLDKNASTKNSEEFRNSEIIKSYELLQSRQKELFTNEQSHRFCMDSTIADMSVKIRAIKASVKLEGGDPGGDSCTCLDDTWCSTGCATGWSCSVGGCTSGSWGCGCVWQASCTKTCKKNELEQ